AVVAVRGEALTVESPSAIAPTTARRASSSPPDAIGEGGGRRGTLDPGEFETEAVALEHARPSGTRSSSCRCERHRARTIEGASAPAGVAVQEGFVSAAAAPC